MNAVTSRLSFPMLETTRGWRLSQPMYSWPKSYSCGLTSMMGAMPSPFRVTSTVGSSGSSLSM